MKKTVIKATLSLAGLFIIYSCGDKFLTRPPQGQYSPNVSQTPNGVEALLVGAYALLDGIGTNDLTPWHGAVSNWVFGGIPSGDGHKGTDAGDQPEQTFIERYVWLPTNEHIYGKWRSLYNGVARTNDVLKTLANVKEVTDTRRAQITAEARFLRGHYHFEAKKMWNMIPYIDDQIYNADDPASVLVPNDKDVWPNIEADFQFAMDNLPESQSDVGRPNKWAATAYLAKCKIFQGFNTQTGAANTAKLTEAKTLLEAVIASGKYSLVPNYHDNFAAETRNNAESLFEVQYSLSATADGGGNQGDGLAWPYNAGPGGCCGFYQPSQDLVNSFRVDANGLPLVETFSDVNVKNDEGIKSSDPFTPETAPLDSRLDWSVGRRGIPFLDWGTHPGADWIRDVTYAGPFSPKKHISSKAKSGVSGWTNLNANNYRLLRYSHVLLWAAECETELGNLAKATEYVNQIRARAAHPAGFVKNADGTPAANYLVKEYPAAFADAATARKAVRFEEKLEFSMEGTRFFDLARWGIADQELNAYVSRESKRRTYLNGAVFKKGTNEYYPIPQNAITYSVKAGKPTLIQNPNY